MPTSANTNWAVANAPSLNVDSINNKWADGLFKEYIGVLVRLPIMLSWSLRANSVSIRAMQSEVNV